MLAWSTGTGLAAWFALTAFAVSTGIVMIRLEVEELLTRFGPEYARYRGRAAENRKMTQFETPSPANCL